MILGIQEKYISAEQILQVSFLWLILSHLISEPLWLLVFLKKNCKGKVVGKKNVTRCTSNPDGYHDTDNALGSSQSVTSV